MLENAASGTVFSFDHEAPVIPAAPEQAVAQDLDAGVAIRGSVRNACFIRRLTSSGAVLHADFALEADERLSLELENGQRLDGTIAWRSGGEAGLTFDRPVDVFAIIARNMVNMPGERRRLPRIQVRCGAHLEAPSGQELAETVDVSQGGAKLQTRLRVHPGEAVQVTLDGLFPIAGVVRWAKDGMAGIAFTPERSWQELMPWLKALRELVERRKSAAAAYVPPPVREQRHPAMARLDDRDQEVHLNIPARVREGTTRWNIEIRALTPQGVEFESSAPISLGAFIWVVLPGLEGWPGRILQIDGNRFICAFSQVLQAPMLERVLAAAKEGGEAGSDLSG